MGVTLAATCILHGSNQPIGGRGYVSLAELQVAMRLPPVMDRPRLRTITLHHLSTVDVISAELLDPATLTYRTIHVALPPASGPGAGLNTVAGAIAPVQIRNAWWESWPFVLGMGGLVGSLMLGLCLPVLKLPLIRRHSATVTELHRDTHPPQADGNAVGLGGPSLDHEGDSLTTDGSDRNKQHSPELAVEIAITPLVETPVDKEYAGEFYPVEKRGRLAFSLLELLIVVGITAVLLVLLLTAMRTARLEAQTTQCAMQLQDLGRALQAYANDNQEILPAWSGWHTWPPGGSDDEPKGAAWTVEMIPYLGSPDSRVYNCPGFPAPFKFRNYFLAAQWSGRSGKRCMKLSDIVLSDRFVLSGDKTQLALYPPPLGFSDHLSDDADPDDCGDQLPVLAWPWDSGGFYMHRRGNNVLFGDMHVALMRSYDPHLMTFNPHRSEAWAQVTKD
jgi:type II secretory pathway pseudopilin PulG